MIQDGCSCKVVQESTLERCGNLQLIILLMKCLLKIGCPPESRGETICNPLTNELETQVVKSILIGGKCNEIRETEKQPIDCGDDNLTKPAFLRCNKQTGQGELVRPERRIRNCKCVHEEAILKHGLCSKSTISNTFRISSLTYTLTRFGF